MTTALLIPALLMGFFGSPHCLGMCGGLVTAFGLSMQNVSTRKRHALIATYHIGRLLSYTTLGVIAGLIGTTILEPIMSNNMPRVLLGLIFVFVGMAMLGIPFLNKLEQIGMRFWQFLAPLRQKVFPLTTFPRALTAGLLWGFLPCGLVYGALLIAVVGHDVATGALLMFAFGLGTLPMLVATQEMVAWLHKQIGRFQLRKLNGALMIISGVAVIAVPIAMQSLHGGHHHHHMHNMPMSDSQDMEHMNHQSMEHDMSNMNHMDMENMNHMDMENMNHMDMENMPEHHHMHHDMHQHNETMQHHHNMDEHEHHH